MHLPAPWPALAVFALLPLSPAHAQKPSADDIAHIREELGVNLSLIHI